MHVVRGTRKQNHCTIFSSCNALELLKVLQFPMVPNSIMKTLKQTKKTITLRFRISLHWQLEHEKLRTMASQTTVGVSSCSPSLPSHLHGAGTNRPARCLSTPACGTNPDTPHCSSQGSTDAKMLELYKLLSFLWM